MTDTEPRPRRSVLYMPGANERALEKAKGIPADASFSTLRTRWHRTSKLLPGNGSARR